jgi:hypothetical protein
VQAGDLPDNAVDGGDAYASAGATQGRKMPTSLMDMFQPRNATGDPSNFADALASRSNSLIGLGLGLLQPSRPLQGESAYGNALQGFMGGAGIDARTAAEAAKLKQQALQNTRQAAQDAFMRQMAEKQFARGGETPFQKMTADITKYGTPAEQFYASQLGNVPQIASIDDPNNPGDKISVLFNPRAPAGQQISRINPAGAGGTAGPDPFANAPNPFASGGSAQAPVAPGGAAPGAVGYGAGGLGPGGFGTGAATTQPSSPFTSAGTAQSGQGPVEAKTMREARAKAVIANEEDAVKSARAAAEFKPALDEMTAAYEALARAGGVGPVQGSDIGRKVQAVTGYGGANESLRQRYDTARGKVQALVTAAQNKGEGAVSNYERQMFGAQFPQLNALDAKTQLPFLRQLQVATNQSISAGRGTSLGASPGTFMRAPIEQPTPQEPKTKAPVSVQTPEEARKLPRGTQFVIPDGSGRIGTVP